MAKTSTKSTRKNDVAFVRTEDAALLPPPASQAGITGWLWQNIFASMSDFTSIGATIRSLLVAALSLFCSILAVCRYMH